MGLTIYGTPKLYLTSSKCTTVNDCHLNSSYFNFSLFCLDMAIILAINLTKTFRNEGTELHPMICNFISMRSSACTPNVATPVPSGLYSTGDVEGDDTDDANSSINQHKFNEISMLDIPTCSLDLNTPILSHVSDTGVD